jgi:hypothetical protein
MAFTTYIGSGQGVAKYSASGLPGGNPALQSVNALEAGRIRVVFTRAMDFTHPALLEPSNYLYTYDGTVYPVFCCLQVDTQTVDLLVPIIPEIITTATAHLKVLEGRDPRGVALDPILNETDFTAQGVNWTSAPTHLTALLGTYQGLSVDDLPATWLGSSATLLLTRKKTMKIQFQSTEKLRVRLPPFLNKNDWSYIMGTDQATLYIKCPDGTLLQTGVGGVPVPTYDSDVRMWSVDLDVSYYTAHADPSTNEWKVYAVSDDANYVPQWASYFWGDYVDDVTTAKTSAGSADTKLGTPAVTVSDDIAAVKTDTAAIKLKTDNLPADPADESLLEAAIAGVQADTTAISAAVTAVDTKLGTPAGASVSADIASVQTVADTLQDVATGKWVIDVLNNQLVLSRWNGSSWVEFKRFDLFDKDGNPSSSKIYSRIPV